MGSAPSGASSSTDCSEQHNPCRKSIASLITADLVRLELRSSDSNEAIRELLQMIHRIYPLNDLDAVYNSLIRRESVMSTGIGRGVAIPHAAIPRLPRIYAAMGMSSKGIDFLSPDGDGAAVIVLVLFPEEAHREHIEILARFSKLFRQNAFLSTLKRVESATELVDILAEYEALMQDDE